jgi:hypothetical protein
MIDFTTPMLDQNGDKVKQNFKKPVIEKGKVKEVNEYREITLNDICRIALLKSHDEDHTPEIVLKRYKLFRKIYNQGKVELTEDEKSFLSELICISHEVIFAGQAIELLTN